MANAVKTAGCGRWAGSKRATDKFFADPDDEPLPIRVDCSGRVGIKPA